MFDNKLIYAMFAIFLFAAINAAYGLEAVLFEEDFEELVLQDTINEEVARNKVWTDIPPEGWTIEDDLCDGMPEWDGWAFADGSWWMQTAGDQERNQFINGKAEGIIAIADPDEWDDLGSPGSRCKYNTWLSTPPINIASAAAESLVLTFDSSWRPEDTQNAHLSVSFDGGAEIVIMKMTSQGTNTLYEEPLDNFDELIPDLQQVNETMELEIPNPKGSKTVIITWAMTDATNDWWWAIDNISLKTTEMAVSAKGKLASTWGSVKNQ